MSKDYNYHYDKIAEVYEQFRVAEWDDKMFPWFMENIKNRIELNENDVLADLGGATGKVLSYLRKLVNPKHQWINIDPSPKMCEVASQKEGLVVLQSRADTVVKAIKEASLEHQPNKFIAKHCAHHFQDAIPNLAKELFSFLPAGGKVLLLVTDKKCSLPLWSSLAESFRVSNADPTIYVHAFQEAGFSVTIDKPDYTTKVSKQFWYGFIRNRAFSTFRNMTDEEIEAGLKELDSMFPDTEELPITDHEVFVVATK